METICIHLFGRFTVATDGSNGIEALSHKGQELLAYILLHRERWHSRERLAALLWPDSDQLDSRARLRRLIWKIHDDLRGEPGSRRTRLLNVEDEWVSLNPTMLLSLDIDQFEQSYQLGQNIPFDQISPELAQTLHLAAGLYQGDLLEDWDQYWCIGERERFKIMLLTMLSKLARYHFAREQFEQGILVASNILQIDRAHEGAHRQLMRLQYAAGNRTGALRQFHLCKVALLEELDVQPGNRTVHLYKQIYRDDFTPQVEPISVGGQSFPRTTIADLYVQVEQLQQTILNSHCELSEHIRSLQHALEIDS